jgi:hypothetical protein
MAAATVTGRQIRQGLYTEHGDWVFLGVAVGTQAANYIRDTERLQGVNLPSSAYDNCIVRIASGTKAGETAGVDYLDVETGQLFLTPSLTGALTAADEYEIWLKGIDPDVADRLRDNALNMWCSVWRPNPLTKIQDGDFEEPGVTLWSVSGGGATRTKSLAAFEDDLSGRWNLTVNNTVATTDYVESEGMFVTPGQRFYIEAPVSAYTGAGLSATATLLVRDVTQTANISLGGIKTTHAGLGWGRLSIIFTVPAGCFEIRIRLTTSTASGVSIWGPIAMHRLDDTRMNLPDRIRSKHRVATQYMLTNPSSSVIGQNSQYKIRNFKNTERTDVGSRVVLWFNPPLGEESVWYYERGYFEKLQTAYYTVAGRLAGDAATTDCPLEYVVAWTAKLIAEFYMQKYGSDWSDDLIQAAGRVNYWESQFGPEPKNVMENEQPVYIPQLQI